MAKLLTTESDLKLGLAFPELGQLTSACLGGRVGILAESVEHGLELRRHLPGWPLLTAETAVQEGLSPSDIARLSTMKGDPGLVHRDVIVTASAMPLAGRFNVLVRADAGVDLPAAGDGNLLGVAGVDDDLVVIDFDDRNHPLARIWTRSRKAAYEAMGWNVVGGPQTTSKDRIQAPGRGMPLVLPYQSPTRHRFVEGDPRTGAYHYRMRRERRRKQLMQDDGGQITLRQIADPDHLVDCFRKLVKEGGPAAGIDGISPRAISRWDVSKIAEKLSAALLEKRWRPQGTRNVPIPKPGSPENRTLKIGVILDRVVGKALHEKLQPFWEKVYLKNSFGFRPARSCWQMLAELEATMEKHDCWVLAIDDVRKAFDNVKIKEAIKAHQLAQASKSKGKQPPLADEVIELIEVVLRGHDDRDVGIDQGGCYSPHALNIFLHIVHDIPLDAVDEVLLWFRYADNLVYVVRSVSEGNRVLTLVRRLLRKVGLSLKGEDGIADLSAGNRAQLLGFTLWREDGRLWIGLGEKSLPQLREHLVKAWETSDPHITARTILRGWIDANGPSFENGVAVIPDVILLASGLGFREVPGVGELTGWWEEAWERWLACRRCARRRVMRRKGR